MLRVFGSGDSFFTRSLSHNKPRYKNEGEDIKFHIFGIGPTLLVVGSMRMGISACMSIDVCPIESHPAVSTMHACMHSIYRHTQLGLAAIRATPPMAKTIGVIILIG